MKQENKIIEEVLKEATNKVFNKLEVAEDSLEYQNYINDDLSDYITKEAIKLTLKLQREDELKFLKGLHNQLKLIVKSEMLDNRIKELEDKK